MASRLSADERQILRLALEIARDTEMALLQGHSHLTKEQREAFPGYLQAKRNVANFDRVLARHFPCEIEPKPAGQPVKIQDLILSEKDPRT